MIKVYNGVLIITFREYIKRHRKYAIMQLIFPKRYSYADRHALQSQRDFIQELREKKIPKDCYIGLKLVRK